MAEHRVNGINARTVSIQMIPSRQTLARFFAITCLLVSTRRWPQCGKTSIEVEACGSMEVQASVSELPPDHGVHHCMVRNVVEMMMKRTVFVFVFMFSSSRSKYLLDSFHFFVCRHCSVRTFLLRICRNRSAHTK
jgi:hypothetical protein